MSTSHKTNFVTCEIHLIENNSPLQPILHLTKLTVPPLGEVQFVPDVPVLAPQPQDPVEDLLHDAAGVERAAAAHRGQQLAHEVVLRLVVGEKDKRW